jgi:hypothetical protein
MIDNMLRNLLRLRRVLAISSGAALSSCEAGPDPAPPGGPCARVAIHSDYRSTAISLLHPDGTPCALDLLDSGRAAPGLLNALSGDVVTTRGPRPDGLVGVLDRYPAGVLTLLDPATGRVTHQTPLAPGFAGNPQDVLPLGPGLDLVTRLARAPSSGPSTPGAPAEEAGSDLLLVTHPSPDPLQTLSGRLLGRLSLDGLATAGHLAMPTRLAHAGDTVFIGLAHLSPDFAQAGPGRIARLPLPPPPTDAPGQAPDDASRAAWLAALTPDVVPLAPWENCAAVEADPGGAGAWVVCTGGFRGSAETVADGQASRSGLAFVRTDGVVAFRASAEALTSPLGAVSPLGFTLAAFSARAAVVVALGDFAADRADRALLVVRAEGDAPTFGVHPLAETAPFAFGAALLAGSTLLLADGDPSRPRLLRLEGLDGMTVHSAASAPPTFTVTPLPKTSRTGLPPRHLAIF